MGRARRRRMRGMIRIGRAGGRRMRLEGRLRKRLKKIPTIFR